MTMTVDILLKIVATTSTVLLLPVVILYYCLLLVLIILLLVLFRFHFDIYTKTFKFNDLCFMRIICSCTYAVIVITVALMNSISMWLTFAIFILYGKLS